MAEGTVFDISHYMLEDGPGIRTNVFVKGCFLRCKWCSNVYGLEKEEELSYDRERCTGCAACVKACPKQAIIINAPGEKSVTDFGKCRSWNLSESTDEKEVNADAGSPNEQITNKQGCNFESKGAGSPDTQEANNSGCNFECKGDDSSGDNSANNRGCNFECVSACPSRARKRIGFRCSSDEAYKEIVKDRMFYRRSEGGVTMSGGEILMQPEFVKEILKKCALNGINTAIETSGFGKWEDLSEIIKFTDTVFMDLKCMDPEKHKELTGVPNELILANIRKAKAQCEKQGSKFVVRLPLIPGLNDDEENLKATAEFVKSFDDPVLLNILPYHNYGENKYEYVGKNYELKETEPPTKADLERVKAILGKSGVRFTIGGYDI